MKLIADSGSTKTDWALISDQGDVLMTCNTQGINPIHQSDADILQILCDKLVLNEQPQEVFFYGQKRLPPRLLQKSRNHDQAEQDYCFL